jgi:hypothetical protein
VSWPASADADLRAAPGRYTAHVEGQLRACALDALQSVTRSAPRLRGAVLGSVAKFLATIPDEAVQVGVEAGSGAKRL